MPRKRNSSNSDILTTDLLKKWDRQIRLFARYFLANAVLPKDEKFTLLDVGCGTGSALREIKRIYQQSDLYGCDIEKEHVDLSVQLNDEFGKFFCSDILRVTGFFDVVYASNILEHLPFWKDATYHLLEIARQVYVMVPYEEILEAQTQNGHAAIDMHINSFGLKSFDFLLPQGISVESRVILAPVAWGPPIEQEIKWFIRSMFGQERRCLPRQALFCLKSGASGDGRSAFGFGNRLTSGVRLIFSGGTDILFGR